MSDRYVTDADSAIMSAVSYALKGKIGQEDDVERLKKEIEGGQSTDKLRTACEIAVAFIRLVQDKKADLERLQNRVEALEKRVDALYSPRIRSGLT